MRRRHDHLLLARPHARRPRLHQARLHHDDLPAILVLGEVLGLPDVGEGGGLREEEGGGLGGGVADLDELGALLGGAGHLLPGGEGAEDAVGHGADGLGAGLLGGGGGRRARLEVGGEDAPVGEGFVEGYFFFFASVSCGLGWGGGARTGLVGVVLAAEGLRQGGGPGREQAVAAALVHGHGQLEEVGDGVLDEGGGAADERVGAVALDEVDERRRQVRRADQHQAGLVRRVELERRLVAVELLDVRLDGVEDGRHLLAHDEVVDRLRQLRLPGSRGIGAGAVLAEPFLAQRVGVGGVAVALRLARAETGEERGHAGGGPGARAAD